MALTNIHIAVLTKLNELTERFGLKPSDFIAECRAHSQDGIGGLELAFCTAPSTPEKRAHFDKLFEALGVPGDGALRGTEEEVYDLVERALQRAPRSRWDRYSSN